MAISTHVSEAAYLEGYAAQFYEWVDGAVIPMSPVHERHDALTRYLATLLDTYFELRPIGVIRQAPFVMRLAHVPSNREPDIQIILNTNHANLTETYTNGPADIVIEVVSPESVERDHGTKFAEYEQGGVPEYWIIDPLRREGRFYRRDADGVYIPQTADSHYQTPALPDFKLHLSTLWEDNLPKPSAIVQAVRQMLP